MRRLAFALTILLGMQTGAASASDNPVVVELFSSQGCPACPAADEILKDLSTSDEVIALAWHVNYWDYMGWKDVFAKPVFTKRQKYYAYALGEKMVYTPQMIFNGIEHEVGNDEPLVSKRVKALSGGEPLVALEATRQGNVLRITARDAQTTSEKIDVYVIHYIEKSTVEITRGENAGRMDTYVNIVSDWRTVGQWNGQGALSLDVPLTSDLPLVVMLQADGFGQILGARQVK